MSGFTGEKTMGYVHCHRSGSDPAPFAGEEERIHLDVFAVIVGLRRSKRVSSAPWLPAKKMLDCVDRARVALRRE